MGRQVTGWLTRLLRRRAGGGRRLPGDAGPQDAGPGAGEPSTGRCFAPSQVGSAPAASPVRLGRFAIERLLAEGATGCVYQAFDPLQGSRIALKTFSLQGLGGRDDGEVRERFLREAEVAARLHHPDIVHVHESGAHGAVAFIAMELLHGTDLRPHCRPGALLPVPTVLALAARAAGALAHAHTRGVVHRDIKPANLMLDRATDCLKLTDFGIARALTGSRSVTGLLLGTPSYMAPEQLVGDAVDGRADLYALGVLLFELLTARLPHECASVSQMMRAILAEPAPDVGLLRPELPGAVAAVLARALRKDRAMRYADGLEMAQALRAAADGLR